MHTFRDWLLLEFGNSVWELKLASGPEKETKNFEILSGPAHLGLHSAHQVPEPSISICKKKELLFSCVLCA